MKSPEEVLEEFVLDEIPFNVGYANIQVLTRSEFEALYKAIRLSDTWLTLELLVNQILFQRKLGSIQAKSNLREILDGIVQANKCGWLSSLTLGKLAQLGGFKQLRDWVFGK